MRYAPGLKARAYARLDQLHDAGARDSHGQRLTRLFRDIGKCLVSLANPGTGRCVVTYARLAQKVRCSQASIGRALPVLRELGVIAGQLRRRESRDRYKPNLYFIELDPVERTEKKGVELLPRKLSEGQPPAAAPKPAAPALEAVLARLGAAIGVPTGQVAPWLMEHPRL